MEGLKSSGIDWGVAFAPHPSQSVLGDGFLVKPTPGGLLLAVVDGLGHGSEAAMASTMCVDTFAANAHLSVLDVLHLCHKRLRGTRGATASAAMFDYAHDEMTWSGVGNVAGILLRADVAARPATDILVPRAGVLGSGTLSVAAHRVWIHPGDTIVLATDGIRRDFDQTLDHRGPPQAAAERILADYSKRTDDALVLVARYAGARS
jgi:negative regulator of sigma-B (phosphoserine phosphatase)